MKLPNEDTVSGVAVRTFVPFAEKSSSAAATRPIEDRTSPR